MKPPLGPRQMLFSMNESMDPIVEGYYSLEETEQGESSATISRHRHEIILWYHALTLYRRGMLSEWNYAGEAEPNNNRFLAWGLQSQLLGLGVSSAKVALDCLIAGYYSMSLAATRHMLETCIHIDFLQRFPNESPRWRGKGTSSNPSADRPPKVSQLVKRIGGEALKDIKDDPIYASWHLACLGAHPSAQGARQTEGVGQFEMVFGPTYHRELFFAACDHGLFALLNVLRRLYRVQIQSPEWVGEFNHLESSLAQWKETWKSKVDENGLWIGSNETDSEEE